jgi:hypothetical protein
VDSDIGSLAKNVLARICTSCSMFLHWFVVAQYLHCINNINLFNGLSVASLLDNDIHASLTAFDAQCPRLVPAVPVHRSKSHKEPRDDIRGRNDGHIGLLICRSSHRGASGADIDLKLTIIR